MIITPIAAPIKDAFPKGLCRITDVQQYPKRGLPFTPHIAVDFVDSRGCFFTTAFGVAAKDTPFLVEFLSVCGVAYDITTMLARKKKGQKKRVQEEILSFEESNLIGATFEFSRTRFVRAAKKEGKTK